MRTVLFTMSLSGSLMLISCCLFFRLFGRSLKAKWRRTLLLLTLVFYLLPLPYFKFLLLQGGKMLHIIPDTWGLALASELQSYPYMVYIDGSGRSTYSDAQTIFMVLSGLLLVVFAVIMLYQIANDIRVRNVVRVCSQPAGAEETALLEELKGHMGIRRRIRLAQSELVSVPVVSGVFIPVILLPGGASTDDRALRNMLLHELAHIKHRDILFQWVCLLAVALHWYNPISYLLFHLLTKVNEQYSDAEAVHAFSEQERRCYCEDLIHYSEQAGVGGSSPVVLGFTKDAKKQIRSRIDEVLDKRHRRFGIACCSGGLALLIGMAVTFTYQPPLRIKGSSADEIDQEMLFDKDVSIYFIPGDMGTGTETSALDPVQEEQEE